MEKIKQLTELVYKKAVSEEEDFDYFYNELNVILTCIDKVKFEKEHPNEYYRDKHNRIFDANEALNKVIDLGYIGFAVKTGGFSGGNCWGGEAKYEAESGVSFDNIYLDSVLEIVAPNVSYLSYKKLYKDLVIKKEHTVFEYYGNNETYYVELMPLNELLNFLKEKNVLISEDEVNQLLPKYEAEKKTKKVKP